MKKMILAYVILLISVSAIFAQEKIMYVNSQEGLRVRNLPSTSGERIGVIKFLDEVRIIREDNNNININGIDGKWVFIKGNNIEGWVFNGYLSSSKKLIIWGQNIEEAVLLLGKPVPNNFRKLSNTSYSKLNNDGTNLIVYINNNVIEACSVVEPKDYSPEKYGFYPYDVIKNQNFLQIHVTNHVTAFYKRNDIYLIQTLPSERIDGLWAITLTRDLGWGKIFSLWN